MRINRSTTIDPVFIAGCGPDAPWRKDEALRLFG
jgi:hypothetical protein